MPTETLFFAESLSRPMLLDSHSCDFRTPLRRRDDLFQLNDTSAVRDCYRSHRVSLDRIKHTNKAITVFLHNADDLAYGAARVTLWRKLSGLSYQGDIGATKIVGDEACFELVCMTRSMMQGTACGTVLVSGEFDSMVVTVLQPCTGITVHVTDPAVTDNSPIPTVGINRSNA